MGRLANEMLNLCHKMRGLSEDRRAFITDLKVNQSKRRKEVQQTLTDFHNERLERFAEIREQLSGSRNKLAESMVDFKKMTAEQAEERVRDLHDIRKDVQQLLKDSQQKLAEAANIGQTERRRFTAAIRQELEELIRNSQSFRHEILSDLVAMKQALHGNYTPQQPGPEPEPEPEIDQEPHAETADEQAGGPPEKTGDDLTRIRGVGPARAFALQESGILTFTDFSTRTVEEFQKIFDGTVPPAAIEAWIAEAARLVTLDKD